MVEGMLTRQEVQRKRERLRQDMVRAKTKVEFVAVQIEELQNLCSHPAKHGTVTMGENGEYCPDCGWSV